LETFSPADIKWYILINFEVPLLSLTFEGSKVQVPPRTALLVSFKRGGEPHLSRVGPLNHPSDTVDVLRLPLSFDPGERLHNPGRGVEVT